MIDITALDKELYYKYNDDILQAMQNTPFNLSREITKLLGPYFYYDKSAIDQPPNYGLIERKAHSYVGLSHRNNDNEEKIKLSINYLNELLLLDPWGVSEKITFTYDTKNKSKTQNAINAFKDDEKSFNKEYEEKLLIKKKNIKDIFPSRKTINISNSIERLHLPPAIFYKQQKRTKNYRFKELFDEISKHCKRKQITITGKNIPENICDCLYVLSISHKGTWDMENGVLNFPMSLKTWYSTYLAKYCDYYIVTNGYYCNMNTDTKFKKISDDKITMSRSGKTYECHGLNEELIRHIMIFDNYQKINITGGAVDDANNAGG